MSPKLVPPNPSETMVIRQVTSDITTLSTPFKRLGRIQIGGRGTLVRLPSGSVAVFSPVALTDDVKRTVSGMGELKYIIAPDLEHHVFLHPWHSAYPSAKVLGPSGLASKRKAQKDDPVPVAVEYATASTQPNSVSVDPEFDATFDSAYVPAHPNRELVYNHRPSGTLIQADLLPNQPPTEQCSRLPGGWQGADAGGGSWLSRLARSLTHTQGDALWPRRFLWYGLSRADRPGFSRSVVEIGGWHFDRIIPCHGDVIETGAKEVYEKMFRWHYELDAARRTREREEGNRNGNGKL